MIGPDMNSQLPTKVHADRSGAYFPEWKSVLDSTVLYTACTVCILKVHDDSFEINARFSFPLNYS